MWHCVAHKHSQICGTVWHINSQICGTVWHINTVKYVAHKHRRLMAKGEMDNDLNTSLKQPTNSPLHCWIRAQFIVIEAGKLSLFFCVSVDKISYVKMLKRYTFMEVEELSLSYIYRSNQLNIEQFTLKKNMYFFL